MTTPTPPLPSPHTHTCPNPGASKRDGEVDGRDGNQSSVSQLHKERGREDDPLQSHTRPPTSHPSQCDHLEDKGALESVSLRLASSI